MNANFASGFDFRSIVRIFGTAQPLFPINSLTGSDKGDLSKLNAELEVLTTTGAAEPYLRRLKEGIDIPTMLSGKRHKMQLSTTG